MTKDLFFDPVAVPRPGDLDFLLAGETQEDRIRLAHAEIQRIQSLPPNFERGRLLHVLIYWVHWAEHLLQWSRSNSGKQVQQQSLQEWTAMMGSINDGLNSD